MHRDVSLKSQLFRKMMKEITRMASLGNFVIPDFMNQSERLEIQLRNSLKLYCGLSYHTEYWELDLFFLLADFQKLFYY